MKYRLFLVFAVLSLIVAGTQAQPQPSLAGHPRNPELHSTDPAFFKTADALRIGDQVLLYQRTTGGWPKNIDMARPLSDDERVAIAAEKNRRNDSTTDNGATTLQMIYLAPPPKPGVPAIAATASGVQWTICSADNTTTAAGLSSGRRRTATNGTSRSTTTRW